MGQNVDEAIETIQACLRVLDLANRIDGLIQSKKYYSALRVSKLWQYLQSRVLRA